MSPLDIVLRVAVSRMESENGCARLLRLRRQRLQGDRLYEYRETLRVDVPPLEKLDDGTLRIPGRGHENLAGGRGDVILEVFVGRVKRGDQSEPAQAPRQRAVRVALLAGVAVLLVGFVLSVLLEHAKQYVGP